MERGLTAEKITQLVSRQTSAKERVGEPLIETQVLYAARILASGLVAQF